MYRKTPARQQTCFIAGSLSDYVPEDHILRRVHAVLDLGWLEEEVKELYAEVGRPCIEPERALRLMLAGFFHGVVHDRTLVREAQVNLAYRWFAGYELGEALPEHSSLTRIRQRWGEARFRRLFERIVAQCQQAGLAGGETVHVDASLIRANVSWSSLVTEHVTRVLTENETEESPPPPESGRKVSQTDPEATMATSHRKQRLEPSYKQHTAVDDQAGVIVDVHVTTGAVRESRELLPQLDRVAECLGRAPEVVTADRGYAGGTNYSRLEEAGQLAVIPPPREAAPRTAMPLSRFAYDPQQDRVRCPAGKHLFRRSRNQQGWFYRAPAKDCQHCPLRAKCLPPTARRRSVLISDGYPALLRARRRRLKGWSQSFRDAYDRHRTLVEGVFGEAKDRHGLRRAVRRGLSNLRIQAYLTAAVINLKRLARRTPPTCVGPKGARRRHQGLSSACSFPISNRRSFSHPKCRLPDRYGLCWNRRKT